MSDRDFKIGSSEFQLSKMDAFKQFHIVRRIAPILGDLLPVISKAKQLNSGELSEEQKLESLGAVMTPIMTGLSKLSDEDANKVLFGLLSSVSLKQSAGNFARLATDTQLMFADLELPVLMQAAGRAFAYNLSGFFGALPRV